MQRKRGSLAVLLFTFLLSILPFPSVVRVAHVVVPADGEPGWTLTTTDVSRDYAPTFLGNGYIGERIPAQGMGYAIKPFPNLTAIAGFYDQAESRASLPTLSTLVFSDGHSTYGLNTFSAAGSGLARQLPDQGNLGKINSYQQTLDLYRGLLTTSATWTSSTGNVTDLRYQVMLDQARPHLAAVQLTFTPHWNGQASVTDLLDGASAKETTGSGRGFSQPDAQIAETVTASGSGIVAGLASRLDTSEVPNTTISQQQTNADETIGQKATFAVVAGQTRTFTKYIGVTTSREDADPLSASEHYSTLAAKLGYQKLLLEHENAWSKLWQSDLQITGDSQLQLEARASMFYLLESMRVGMNWSIPPGGLSTDAYKGHIFWDAETWMYPPLLLTHLDIALGVNTYRQERLRANQQNANAQLERGARIGWESALTGADVAPYPENPLEIHISSDVALAQWQYYLATGDRGWLAKHAWPLLSQIAQFWVSRVTADPTGGYNINGVQGPDEYHYPVNNSAYINGTAATSLHIAVQAAQVLGRTPDPLWNTIAAGLKVPVDHALNIHPEFSGYTGDTIKQADVVMLQYPWEYPMSSQLARSDLRYYAPRLDIHGPSMSDAIHAIDACTLNDSGAAYTYLQQSIRPFLRPPFDQIAENQVGAGAFTFITGIGGFLQEFYYGFTGLRWRADRLHLDPCLPPQMQGITLTGLHWQGRVFKLAIAHNSTLLTLVSGPALPVEVGRQALQTVPSQGTLVMSTR